MNEVVGFASIKHYTTSGTSAISLDNFNGKIVRVLEFAKDGGVLVIDDKAQGLATFDKEDVFKSFKCSYKNGIVIPPDLSIFSELEYMSKCRFRKGGYNNLLAQMVIIASILKEQFTDGFLWSKQ